MQQLPNDMIHINLKVINRLVTAPSPLFRPRGYSPKIQFRKLKKREILQKKWHHRSQYMLLK